MTRFVNLDTRRTKTSLDYITVTVSARCNPPEGTRKFDAIGDLMYHIKEALLELGLKLTVIEDTSMVFDGEVRCTEDDSTGGMDVVEKVLNPLYGINKGDSLVTVYIECHANMSVDPLGEYATKTLNY